MSFAFEHNALCYCGHEYKRHISNYSNCFDCNAISMDPLRCDGFKHWVAMPVEQHMAAFWEEFNS